MIGQLPGRTNLGQRRRSSLGVFGRQDTTIIYVDTSIDNSNYDNDGYSWENAKPNLATGIDLYADLFYQGLTDNVEIWVTGTVNRSYGVHSIFTSDYETSIPNWDWTIYLMFPGIKIYGGFDGTETSKSQRTGKTLTRMRFIYVDVAQKPSFVSFANIYTVGRDENLPSYRTLQDYIDNSVNSLSDWSESNAMIVDGFEFDYDDFEDVAGVGADAQFDRFVSNDNSVDYGERVTFQNCAFRWDSAVNKTDDIFNTTSNYKAYGTNGSDNGGQELIHDRPMIISQHENFLLKDCDIYGSEINLTIERGPSASTVRQGGIIKINPSVELISGSIEDCTFHDFELNLTGISGLDGVDSTNYLNFRGDIYSVRDGGEATFFTGNLVHADAITNASTVNCSLTHNGASLVGGNGFDGPALGGDPFGVEVIADEATSGINYGDDYYPAGQYGYFGGRGGRCQYGTSGDGGDAGSVSGGVTGGYGGDAGRTIQGKGTVGTPGSGADGTPDGRTLYFEDDSDDIEIYYMFKTN